MRDGMKEFFGFPSYSLRVLIALEPSIIIVSLLIGFLCPLG